MNLDIYKFIAWTDKILTVNIYFVNQLSNLIYLILEIKSLQQLHIIYDVCVCVRM